MSRENPVDIVPYKESFPPVMRQGAAVLILGSLPGDESLRQRQYYAHKRNAFWPIMGQLFGFDPTAPYETRLDCLLSSRVGIWDILASGIRPGSLDMKITSPRVNDLPDLLKRYPSLKAICCNGGTSHRYLMKYFPAIPASSVSVCKLPSTSPAAAMLTMQDKLEAYRDVIGRVLEETAS